jgi:hypothetical protein
MPLLRCILYIKYAGVFLGPRYGEEILRKKITKNLAKSVMLQNY